MPDIDRTIRSAGWIAQLASLYMNKGRNLTCSMKEDTMFGLYIHIPFCLNKCPYCDFNSSDHAWGLADDYIAALLAQAAGQEKDRDRDVRQDTIGKAEGASRRGTMPWTNGTARQDRTPWAGDRFWQAGRAALQDSIDTGTDKKDCKPDSCLLYTSRCV